MNEIPHNIEDLLRSLAEVGGVTEPFGNIESQMFDRCWPEFRVRAHHEANTLVFQKWREAHASRCSACQEVLSRVGLDSIAVQELGLVLEQRLLVPDSVVFEDRLLFAASAPPDLEGEFLQESKLPYVDYVRIGPASKRAVDLWLVFYQRSIVLALIGDAVDMFDENGPQVCVGEVKDGVEVAPITAAASRTLFPSEFAPKACIQCYNILLGQGQVFGRCIHLPELLEQPLVIHADRPKGETRLDPFVRLIDQGLPQPLFDALEDLSRSPASIAKASCYLRLLYRQQRRLSEAHWVRARSMPWLNDNLTPILAEYQ